MEKQFKKLLKDIKSRPGVYFGKKDLDSLITFLWGYVACLEQSYDVSFLVGFQGFVEKYYKISGFWNWVQIVCFFNVDEDSAFDCFFELLKQFEKEGGKIISISGDNLNSKAH